MASIAELSDVAPRGSTQFIITVDRIEKQRWKAAADDAGLSMAEYVRRAVVQAADAPTAAEIAEAKALAAEINASVDRMEIMLDRTLQQLADAVDPAADTARREAILSGLHSRGEYLDLNLLASRLQA